MGMGKEWSFMFFSLKEVGNVPSSGGKGTKGGLKAGVRFLSG